MLDKARYGNSPNLSNFDTIWYGKFDKNRGKPPEKRDFFNRFESNRGAIFDKNDKLSVLYQIWAPIQYKERLFTDLIYRINQFLITFCSSIRGKPPILIDNPVKMIDFSSIYYRI